MSDENLKPNLCMVIGSSKEEIYEGPAPVKGLKTKKSTLNLYKHYFIMLRTLCPASFRTVLVLLSWFTRDAEGDEVSVAHTLVLSGTQHECNIHTGVAL